MNEWQNLTRTALLGTDKKAFTPSASQSEIGLLLSELANNTSAEQQLLRSAGVLALCHLAGWVPQAIDPAPLPEIDKENAEPINNPAFAGLLHLLLSEGPPSTSSSAPAVTSIAELWSAKAISTRHPVQCSGRSRVLAGANQRRLGLCSRLH